MEPVLALSPAQYIDLDPIPSQSPMVLRAGRRVVRGACELDLAAAEWLLALLAGERSRG
jgi:hypothetical protein